MSTARRTLLAAAPAALLLPLASCGGRSRDDVVHLAIVSKGFQQQFWQAVKDGAEEEADAQGVVLTFEGPPTESDIEAQVTMLQNTVTRNPDGLALAALDSQAVAQALDEAEEKGIPIVAFDSGVESDLPVATVSTDNAAAAREAAEHMAELVGGQGKVAVIAHDQVSLSGTDRRDGFLEGIEEFAPDVELLETQYGGGDQAVTADLARSILSAHPDLVGMFGTNEGTAIGILRGVQESGRDDVAVVGFDSGRAQVEAIQEGAMAGAVTQNPVAMGRITVQTLLAALRGEEQDRVIDTGFHWYDAENIDTPEIQEAIYL